MKKGTIITAIIFLLSSVVLAVSAEWREVPVNPLQSEVWKNERQLRLEPKAVSNAYSSNLSLTQTQKPALNSTGKWTINPVSGHGSITSLTVGLLMKDYSENYSFLYYKNYYSNIPSVFESCEILTAGEYQVYVKANYSDYTSGTAYLEFTIDGNSALIAKVNQVASSCKKSTQWETALCLHDWIALNMRYDASLGFYGADGALLRGVGVCDSYSKSFYMLCKAAGIPVGRVIGNDHAWNIIQLNGKWYYVDVTWDDGDDDIVPVGYTYFCLNEESIKLDHTAEEYEGEYGPASSLEMNYYVYTKEWKNWPVMSEKNYKYVSLMDDIVAVFEDQGETIYTISDHSLSCYKKSDYNVLCFGNNDIRKKILSYALPLSTAEFKETDGTPMNVEIKQSPLAIKLLTPINVLRLPENLYIIETESFYGNGAKKVVLPRSCWKIESKAFANSKVKTVLFPENMTLYYNSDNIADDAFANCRGLVFVTTNENVIKYAQEHGITVRDK